MAVNVGHVNVPMRITMSACSPTLDLATIATNRKLSVSGELRPLGESSISVQADPAALRPSIARALRDAADEIEQQADAEHGGRLYLNR